MRTFGMDSLKCISKKWDYISMVQLWNLTTASSSNQQPGKLHPSCPVMKQNANGLCFSRYWGLCCSWSFSVRQGTYNRLGVIHSDAGYTLSHSANPVTCGLPTTVQPTAKVSHASFANGTQADAAPSNPVGLETAQIHFYPPCPGLCGCP